MPARFFKVSEPAHDAERQAIQFLVEKLSNDYTVYGNAWLVDRTGAVYELDAVVVAPHALYVVEIKSYRGEVYGTDHDWYVSDEPMRSPLKLNRKTAQVLASALRRQSYDAGRVWVQGFVFLSAAAHVDIRGPASKDRIHTRKTIIQALTDPSLVGRLSGRVLANTTPAFENELVKLIGVIRPGPRPGRRIREYEIVETLERNDRYTEHLARNVLTQQQRVLRVYTVPDASTEEQRRRLEKRVRWEGEVLGRLGHARYILDADPVWADEAGFVMPLENFRGVALSTWIERHGQALAKRRSREGLEARVALWFKIVEAVRHAHSQGVIHRLLRPEVVLVEDKPEDPQIRVTGFDLAKQMTSSETIASTTLGDERLQFAAPEVVGAFSSAEPASDQFSLGALLGLLLSGRPLFESTRELMQQRRLVTRVRDLNPRIPLSLDEAVTRMLGLRPPDRFPSIDDAEQAVRSAVFGRAAPSLPMFPSAEAIDPDDLQPGTPIGPDYKIVERLGEGGLAIVYAAKHVVSGRIRALKIARADDNAEEALRQEYQILSGLDHAGIVRVVDLSNIVQGRLTLVMERVGGQTLRRWIADHPDADANSLRRHAEDLLGALEYLEQRGITHKDIKPDNLLVSDDGLKLIDFSLAGTEDTAAFGGTALYRDPSSLRWSHGTDRYAAALCLFELYTGRHAFDGRAPEPGERPHVAPEDLDPPGLAPFFHKALDPVPAQRFASAAQMREAFLAALGHKPAPVEAEPPLPEQGPTSDLRLTRLSRRAVNQLRRCGISTVGELLSLSAEQIRSIHAIGNKTQSEITAFQEAVRGQGVTALPAAVRTEPVLSPELADSPDPLEALPLKDAVRDALAAAGFRTVGAVAAARRSELLALEGLGPKSVDKILGALRRLASRTPPPDEPLSLDQIWEKATRALEPPQVEALDRFIGVTREPEPQTAIAESMGLSQPQVSRTCSEGLERLDRGALADCLDFVDRLLDGLGGLTTLAHAGARLEETWGQGEVTGEGLARLLVRIAGDRFTLAEVDGVDSPVLARPHFRCEEVERFISETYRLAEHWPPLPQDAARRALQDVLPAFGRDPLALAVSLCGDVQFMEGGELFIPPLNPEQALGLVLERERLPITLERLAQRVEEIFDGKAPLPEPDHLLEVLGRMGFRVQGDQVLERIDRLSVMPASPIWDPLPELGRPSQTYEQGLRDILRDAARSRGFRLLVTPPDQHALIGPSVARALDGTWLSFEDLWFRRHADAEAVSRLERAERFTAQRRLLTRAAEELVETILGEHGRPGNKVVLGDTGLLGVCEALDLIRRLYDETMSGDRGFWALVIPGVIHERQPLFNEKHAVWHQPGITLPLMKPLPVEDAA